ncbi:Glycoside hydrolase [Phytophthora megakarya]|uniref:alpha-1,2-Mannosidase n=1 Tax=Phytophthora megakarya TaxID=4795 RepID=A0A225VJ89_9STRA|nr:Glycoside hydrolase [Phytophthora megakarya]
MVAAMAVLSLFLLAYTHLIYLPAMTGESGNRPFLRARRHRPAMNTTLREFYKSQVKTFNEDQQKVVSMTRHAWHGYRKFAGWSDYLNVVTMKGGNVYGHDMALTTVDSLDTLFLMGLHDEFDEASAWVKANLSDTMFEPYPVSFFEITIRSLGGLLSAYYLSGEKHFLHIADSLGRALQMGFKCGNFVPCRSIDLENFDGYEEPLLSEAGSFQLEFAYLAHATQDDSFMIQVNHMNAIMAELVKTRFPNGLIPVSMDWSNLRPYPNSVISIGALGDSHYEYLLKQWLLTGKTNDQMRDIGVLEPAMEHLTCFVPGMLALGYYHGMPTSHLELAKDLTETCVQMYLQSTSHLAPEITQFTTAANPYDVKQTNPEMFPQPTQDYNILRPETVESLMILYRVTGDEMYREYGRVIMEAFEKYSKIPAGGYRSTNNVWYGSPTTKGGPMESFFIAETLKYLFLLFSDDDILPLDQIVFNTEAHPFPVWR